jgi:hypothetical protein
LTFTEHPPAADDGRQHRLVSQHALHPGERMMDALIRPIAPEAHLVIADRVDTLRAHSHPDDGRAQVSPLQLPAHPVDHVSSGEPAWMQPGPFENRVGFGENLHQNGGTHQ